VDIAGRVKQNLSPKRWASKEAGWLVRLSVIGKDLECLRAAEELPDKGNRQTQPSSGPSERDVIRAPYHNIVVLIP